MVNAERLLSYQVGEFLNRNNQLVDAEYVITVARWHEATDGNEMMVFYASCVHIV